MATSRHLWVGGLPDEMSEDDIRDHFTRFGKVETVKLLPQKFSNMGLAAFVDFYEIEAAKEARNADIRIKGTEVRTNYKSVRPETKEGKEHSRRYYNSPHTKNDSSSSSSGGGSSSNSDSSSSSSDSDSDDKGRDLAMLKVTGLPHNRPDNELLSALYAEFSHYSPKVVVKLFGDGDSKYSIMKFKSTSECKKALKDSQGLSMFGSKIKLATYKRDFPSGGKECSRPNHSEDMDPNATRSLFVGNIPKNISIYELRDVFQRYGAVLDVEIKKMSGNATYGFILYYDLHSAVAAKRYMDGTVIGGNDIRVGFGKGTPSKVLWVDCIDSSVSEQQLKKQFNKYGGVVRMGYDHFRGTSMVQYETVEEAGEALSKIKGSTIGSGKKKIMADYANKDAKAAFFARLERLNVSNGPRPFHPSGPMYPMDGMPHVMMGGPAVPMIPPHMDLYRPYSYMEDYYGYPQPLPSHMRHPYESRGYGDYEDELKAFSRKRERERRMEREDEERKQRHRGYSSDESSDSDRERRRKGKRRRWSSSSDEYQRERRGHSSDNSSSRGDARRRGKRKSRDRQERQKKMNKEEKSSRESPTERSKDKKSSKVSSSTGKRKVEGDMCKMEKVDNVSEKSPEVMMEESGHEKKTVDKKDSNKPKVIIDYQLEEEEEKYEETKKKTRETEEKTMPTQEQKEESSVETMVEPLKQKEEDVPKLPEKEEEEPLRPPSPPPEEALLPVTVRPKISIAWKERDKPLQEGSTRIESDFSSGDEFENMEEDEVIIETEEPASIREKLKGDKEGERRMSVGREECLREVILSHSSETSSEGSGRRGGSDRSRTMVQESRHKDDVGETGRKFGDRQRYRHEDGRGQSRNRNYENRNSHESRHYSRYHQDQRKQGVSPPSVRPRSPPVSPSRGRPRTPIQRPPKPSRHHPPGSPQHDNTFRGRHTLSPPHPRHKESRGGDLRDKRDTNRDVRDRSPRGIPRGSERSRLESPLRRDSPIRRESPTRHHPRHRRNSRSPSPRRYPRSRDNMVKNKREESRVEELPSRPRTPSGSPPLPPAPPEAPVEGIVREKVKPQVQQQPVKPKEPSPQTDVQDLLIRYPVMWQGHFSLKNELAAVQLHLLEGNANLVKSSLPQLTDDGKTPNIRITQRMKLEQSQLDGVESRMKNATEHCLLVAFPTGRDASDVQAQTDILKNSLINYLLQKQAAGIVNVQKDEGNFVLHIFPPCPFSQSRLALVAPDLVNSTSDNCHLMIVIATNNNNN